MRETREQTKPEPDYETISGHLSGEALKAFRLATEAYGGKSKLVVAAVTERLIADGYLPANEKEGRLFDLFKGAVERSKGDAAKVARIEGFLESIIREQEPAPR